MHFKRPDFFPMNYRVFGKTLHSFLIIFFIFQIFDFDLNMVLTTEECAWLVDKPVPHHNAVRNPVDKFQETGSVDDAKHCGRPAKVLEKLFGHF